MARRLTWSDVRGGLIACAVIVAIVFVVLKYSRVGALHGKTFRLYALVGEARGLLKGSEVWLSGQRIGKITDIEFLSPSADTTRRIQISMDILDRHRDALRRDAVADIRAGGGIVGPAVVYLTPGSSRAPEIRSGDTVHMRPQADVESATEKFNAGAKEVPIIVANVKDIAGQLTTTGGSIGAFLHGSGGEQVQRARVQVARLGNSLQGNGSAGLIMRGRLQTRAALVMTRLDSVRALLNSPASSFGRFRRDSSLINEIADIRKELTRVQAQMSSEDGTIGRLRTDSALVNAVADAQRQATLLFADMKKHPLRYLSF